MSIPTIREPLCQKDIIYFLLTDRFYNSDWENNTILSEGILGSPNRYHGGNFSGIAQKIPYLVHLGVTALWITPVYLSIGSYLGQDGYHGYWALDFEKVDPHLTSSRNGREELAGLVEQLHSNGIKVILDMVVNHTGYHTPEYRKHSTLPIHWFKKQEEWNLFGLPKLDHQQADVRDYFVNNIIDWIESTGIDAIRMDSVPHVDNEFWYYFKSYVKGKYRHIFFLGEDLDFDEDVIAEYQRKHDFDSLFDFPLRRNIIDVLIRNEDFKPPRDRLGMMAIASPRLENAAGQHGVLDADTKYNNANRLVTLLDNHDLEKRVMSWALEFSGSDSANAIKLMKYVISFQFTTRGIPQIYYGTELGAEGDQRKDGDSAIRGNMEWFKVDSKTLEPYPNYPEAASIYEHLRKLIRLRRENEALCFGYLFTLFSDFNYYVYLREFRGNTFAIALNNSWKPGVIRVDLAGNANIPGRIKQNLRTRQCLRNVFDPGQDVRYSNGYLSFELAGKTAGIFRLTD